MSIQAHLVIQVVPNITNIIILHDAIFKGTPETYIPRFWGNYFLVVIERLKITAGIRQGFGLLLDGSRKACSALRCGESITCFLL